MSNNTIVGFTRKSDIINTNNAIYRNSVKMYIIDVHKLNTKNVTLCILYNIYAYQECTCA